MSFSHSLPTKDSSPTTSGYGGDCNGVGECKEKKRTVIWNPNNKKYGVQGAVSSSSRIDRLKLETIKGSKHCSTSVENDKCKGGGAGIYFANLDMTQLIINIIKLFSAAKSSRKLRSSSSNMPQKCK